MASKSPSTQCMRLPSSSAFLTTAEEQPMVACWGSTHGASTGVYQAYRAAVEVLLPQGPF